MIVSAAPACAGEAVLDFELFHAWIDRLGHRRAGARVRRRARPARVADASTRCELDKPRGAQRPQRAVLLHASALRIRRRTLRGTVGAGPDRPLGPAYGRGDGGGGSGCPVGTLRRRVERIDSVIHITMRGTSARRIECRFAATCRVANRGTHGHRQRGVNDPGAAA